MAALGKTLIAIGLFTVLAGALIVLWDRFGLGALPGDLVLRGKNWTVYLPITTMVVVSVVLTILLNLFSMK